MYYLIDICCVCLKHTGRLKKLSEVNPEDNITYYKKLSSLFPDMIFEAIHKNGKICSRCCPRLNSVMSFRDQFLRTTRYLMEYASKVFTEDKIYGEPYVNLSDKKQEEKIPSENKEECLKNRDPLLVSLLNSNSTTANSNLENNVDTIDLVTNSDNNMNFDGVDISQFVQVQLNVAGEHFTVVNQGGYDLGNVSILKQQLLASKEAPPATSISRENNIEPEPCVILDDEDSTEENDSGRKGDQQVDFEMEIELNLIRKEESRLSEENIMISGNMGINNDVMPDVNLNNEFNYEGGQEYNNYEVELNQLVGWQTGVKRTSSEMEQNRLLYEGYLLRKDRSLTDGSTAWRCTQRECRGRMKIQHTGEVIVITEHNHGPDPEGNEAKVAVKTRKRAANTNKRRRQRKRVSSENGKHFMLESDPLAIDDFSSNIISSVQTYQPEICKKPEKNSMALTNTEPPSRVLKRGPIPEISNTNIPTISGEMVICERCAEVFPNNETLLTHSLTHNDTTYPCEYCLNSFSSSHNLQNHIRSHTEQTTYECNLCDNLFTDLASLNSHRRIHEVWKPIPCRYCASLFNGFEEREIHERVHKKNVFECEICGIFYGTRRALLTHKEKIHLKELI